MSYGNSGSKIYYPYPWVMLTRSYPGTHLQLYYPGCTLGAVRNPINFYDKGSPGMPWDSLSTSAPTFPTPIPQVYGGRPLCPNLGSQMHHS